MPVARPLFPVRLAPFRVDSNCTPSRPQTSSCGDDITATSWGLSRNKPKILWYQAKSSSNNNLQARSSPDEGRFNRQSLDFL